MDGFDAFFHQALAELQSRERRAFNTIQGWVLEHLPVADAREAVDRAISDRSASRKTLAKSHACLALLEQHAKAAAIFDAAMKTTYAEAVRAVCEVAWDSRLPPAQAMEAVWTCPELNKFADLVAALTARRGGRFPVGWADAVGEWLGEQVEAFTRRKPAVQKTSRAKPRRRPPGTKEDRAIFDNRKLGIPALARLHVKPGETFEEAEARMKRTIGRVYKRQERAKKKSP